MPVIRGAWAEGLADAIMHFAKGDTAEGQAARDAAFDQAPDTPGELDGVRFDWITDADARFGPTFEIIIQGRYGLVAFSEVADCKARGPKDLRDTVWYPVQIQFREGQSVAALLPTRYPGSERSSDLALRMGRSTGWQEEAAGAIGFGPAFAGAFRSRRDRAAHGAVARFRPSLMATAARLTPTIFDKLVADVEISGLRAVDTPQVMSEIMSFYPVPEIKRFGEAALRATVKRDLAWLLNTTQFGARADLEGYAEVQASVLNFGVPDLAGRSHHARTILDLAREIRDSIRIFETRLDPESLVVEPLASKDKANTVVFLIHAEISSGVRPLPVQFRTELETDTAAVEVSE